MLRPHDDNDDFLRVYYNSFYIDIYIYIYIYIYIWIYIYSGVGINKNYMFHNFKFHVCLRSSGE